MCHSGYYGCNSQYRGWMSGSLPSHYDGVVQRTVYFAQQYGSCYSRSTSVWVQNCGSFYVYYFKRYAMSCNYRYCGSDDYKSSILPAASTAVAMASSASPTPPGVCRFQLFNHAFLYTYVRYACPKLLHRVRDYCSED